MICCLTLRVFVNFMELFNLSNLINEVACIKKNCAPSLLDVILTKKKKKKKKKKDYA